MSSRVLDGATVAVREFVWRNLGRPSSSGSAQSHSSTAPDSRAIATEVEAQVERRASEAYARGRQEGSAEAERRVRAEIEPWIERIARTIEELSRVRPALRRDAEEDVVRLSVAIARRILHRELVIDPAALLGMAKSAIEAIDAREVHRVRSHPSDAALLTEEFRRLSLPRQIEITADSSLERGALIFETARGTLDASVTVQLDEIERGLTDIVGRRK